VGVKVGVLVGVEVGVLVGVEVGVKVGVPAVPVNSSKYSPLPPTNEAGVGVA
jgi:hypothetical protein